MSDIQEESICNFILEFREKNKAVGTKSIVCYVGKINYQFVVIRLKLKSCGAIDF